MALEPPLHLSYRQIQSACRLHIGQQGGKATGRGYLTAQCPFVGSVDFDSIWLDLTGG